MNVYSAHFLAAALMFSIGCAATGQNAPPKPSAGKAKVYVIIKRPPPPGSTLYEDKVDGFQFKYPSALQLIDFSLWFENSPGVEYFHSGEWRQPGGQPAPRLSEAGYQS